MESPHRSSHPERCVVLVPVGHHIEPPCERALRELEARGYVVRRVYGYAAIDQARNQMATDALIEGFEELMWIDSDIVFSPDDVERLRGHGLPVVCGIYAKKGQRALAAHVVPGTQRITFGSNGGLTEILYAAAGFLLVRRRVLIDMQVQLELPTCNERFARPTVPFFQPMVKREPGGHWYLAEDYAFCERVRQCGYDVMADTQVRLYHVGKYPFGWEEAGSSAKRYESYDFELLTSPESVGQPLTALRSEQSGDARDRESLAAKWQELQRRYGWPRERPGGGGVCAAWVAPEFRELLARTLDPAIQVVLELGAGLGVVTRSIVHRLAGVRVVAVEDWASLFERADCEDLLQLVPDAKAAFLANCWECRDRIVPIDAAPLPVLGEMSARGLCPDLVLVGPRLPKLRQYIELLGRAFSHRPAVMGHSADACDRQAVREQAHELGRTYEELGGAWRIS